MKTIRQIDIAEYLRGQHNRAAGYAIIANGLDEIDQDGQATDAYCAGYDPLANLVPYKPGKETDGKAFRAALERATQQHRATIRLYRVAVDDHKLDNQRSHVLQEHIGQQVEELRRLHPDADDIRVSAQDNTSGAAHNRPAIAP